MRPKSKYKEQFEILQAEYLNTKNKDILNKMYLLLIDFYKASITKYAKKRNLFFTNEELELKATDSAGFTIKHYLDREDFKIDSLTGYGWFDMLHELTKDKTEDKHSSYEGLCEAYDNEEIPLKQETTKEIHKIYISGKISGDSDFRIKFKKAEEKLKKMGFVVYNPAIMPDGFEYEQYMQLDLKALSFCDSVFFLKDWEESNGAKREYNLAVKLEKKLFFENTI